MFSQGGPPVFLATLLVIQVLFDFIQANWELNYRNSTQAISTKLQQLRKICIAKSQCIYNFLKNLKPLLEVF